MPFWLFCSGLAAFAIAYFSTAEVIEVTVTDKDKRHSRRSTDYLVLTEREVFEVSNSWVFMTFDRDENFSRLQPGRTYEVVVAGWPSGGLMGHRDIIDIVDPAP